VDERVVSAVSNASRTAHRGKGRTPRAVPVSGLRGPPEAEATIFFYFLERERRSHVDLRQTPMGHVESEEPWGVEGTEWPGASVLEEVGQ